MKIRHDPDYRPLRKQAYPPVGDQLDAVMKLAQAMRNTGVELPPEVNAWIDKCQQVKATYRKPEET